MGADIAHKVFSNTWRKVVFFMFMGFLGSSKCKLNRLFLSAATILILAFPSVARAGPNLPGCPSDDTPAREVFSLSINMTFSGHIDFYLCSERESGRSFLLSHKHVNDNNYATRRIPLTEKQQQNIKVIYRRALKFDIMHDERALTIDGSTWCLQKNRGYLNLKACFWSPKEDMHIRKTSDLYSLGKLLVNISGFEKEFSDLY